MWHKPNRKHLTRSLKVICKVSAKGNMIWLKIEIMSLICTIASIWKIVLLELDSDIKDSFLYHVRFTNYHHEQLSARFFLRNASVPTRAIKFFYILQNVTNTLNGVIWRPAGQINQYHTYFSLNDFAEGQKISIKRLDGIQRQ